MSNNLNSTVMTLEQATNFLKKFHTEVELLCKAESPQALLAHRAAVTEMLEQVGPAIEMLEQKETKAPPVALPPVSRPLYDDTQYDKLESIIVKVTQEAQQAGKCPVTAALYRTFFQKEPVPDSPAPKTPEELRARMLRLAEYVLHDFGPKYLTNLNLAKDAQQLARVPVLRERDDLPVAMSVLKDIREEAYKHYNPGYYAHEYDTAWKIVRPFYTRLIGLFDEMDGFIPKAGLVMARLLWLLRENADIRDKDAMDKALRG